MKVYDRRMTRAIRGHAPFELAWPQEVETAKMYQYTVYPSDGRKQHLVSDGSSF